MPGFGLGLGFGFALVPLFFYDEYMLLDFLQNIWIVYLEAAPTFLLGLIVAGLMHAYLPQSLIERAFAGPPLWSIFKASLVGTPIPLCSCGVLPVALKLHQSGAPKPTTASFLVATPETVSYTHLTLPTTPYV